MDSVVKVKSIANVKSGEPERINMSSQDSLPSDWRELTSDIRDKQWFHNLRQFLKQEYKNNVVFPQRQNIFHCFHLTPVASVKIVILGQDPYHGPGQAHGLSFSVPPLIPVPPSLNNIFKELEKIGVHNRDHGCLKSWAEQGVLLLNTVLTVRSGQAGSHRGKGWEQFTDCVLTQLSSTQERIIFMLWGRDAHQKAKLIDVHKHLVLTAPHPSPLSAYRGFFGCDHFRQANDDLIARGKTPVNWQLEQI